MKVVLSQLLTVVVLHPLPTVLHQLSQVLRVLAIC